jgi:HK97 family phage portal protein
VKQKVSITQRLKQFFVRSVDIQDHTAGRYFGSQSDSGATVTQEVVLGLSAVWACMNLLVGTTGSLPIMVYKTKADERQKDTKHPLYRILHTSPNADQTAVDFWEYMAASLELRGNAYARKEFNAGKLVSLWPINAANCSVRRLTDGRLEYTWTDDGKAYRETEENIFHIRGFGGSPLGGLSTLHYARNAFGLARSIEEAANNTFKNGLRPSGTLTFEKFLSPENRATAHAEMVDQFSGAVNAGKPMILEGGTKWEALTINPEDAQMLESRAFSVEDICRFFGVPPFMIGHSEKSTSWGTGLEQQVLAFQKFTLRRRLRRIEMAIMQQLMTPEDRAAGMIVEFQMEGLLRGDSAARSAFYQSGLQNGWMVINEVRRWEDLPPVEGGDVPRMQSQNIPITQSSQFAAPPMPNPATQTG